jgi:7-cyano-7-deazaguanine synthase
MKAIVVFSGGIDSTVVLAHAMALRRECIAVSFDYMQRHRCELKAAKAIAAHYKVEHRVVQIDPAILKGSSSFLVDTTFPAERNSAPPHTPSTFVPCRNLLFLSHAATMAQCLKITEIYFGANQDDFTCYPDCRDPFFRSFQETVMLGSPSELSISVICPLIKKTKTEIIKLGQSLQAPLHLTWSCYDPQNDRPCGKCQACCLRESDFKESLGTYEHTNNPCHPCSHTSNSPPSSRF